MKKIAWMLLALTIGTTASARQKPESDRKTLLATISALTAKIDSLERAVDRLERNCVPVRKKIDPAWDKWQDVRYNYGFDPNDQPVHNTVDGILESTTMLSVRGGRGRWHSNATKPKTSFVDGGHLFEGWNGSETCRLTMLIGKQAPDIACIQVYSPKGLYRPVRHFGWVKLGSDDRNEGVDFGRRWAISFVPFSLAALDEAPTGTMYENAQLGSTAIPVGTLYYDRRTDRVRCFTAEGWRYLAFE